MQAESVRLSSEQMASYREQGFVLLEGLFPEESLARWSQRFEAIVLGEVPAAEKMIVMKDVMFVKGVRKPETPLHAVNKILSFEHDPVLWEYAIAPALLAAVRSLVGPSLFSISTNVFNKPPGVDGRHPLHQDLRYFALRPADQIIASWTAIDPCTRETGCLSVVPGSHRGALQSHGDPDWEYVNSGFFAIEDADLDARAHVEMAPGDTLLFHPLLVHGSGRNRSQGFRRAISAHFASTECERPKQARKGPAVVKTI